MKFGDDVKKILEDGEDVKSPFGHLDITITRDMVESILNGAKFYMEVGDVSLTISVGDKVDEEVSFGDLDEWLGKESVANGK